MHQFCLQAIYNRDFSTLKEIMVKFNYFLQISHQVTDAEFTNIISNLKEEAIVKQEPLYLQASNIYFFFEKGAIYRRQMAGKSQKSIRIREKNRNFTNINKSFHQKLPQIKEKTGYQIDQFDSFQEKGYSANKNVYYCFLSKPTIALRLPLNNLSQELQQILKSLYNQKVKFLSEYGHPINLQKHIIMNHIHKFQYMVMSFGQRLYAKQLRPSLLFFIKNGAAQVHHCDKNMSKSIVNGKAVIGVQRQEQESARCISDKLQCYVIKKEFLNRHFLRYSQKKEDNLTKPQNLLNLSKTAVTTPNFSGQQPQLLQNKLQQTQKDRKLECQFRESLTRGKSGHSSVYSIKDKGEQKGRLFKLKQHFSNFYNEVFEQYSYRKVKHMGLNLGNKENLVLYNLKVLERKAPDMDEIKHKLSKIRMQKLKRCKQKLRGEGHHRVLTLAENGLNRVEQ